MMRKLSSRSFTSRIANPDGWISTGSSGCAASAPAAVRSCSRGAASLALMMRDRGTITMITPARSPKASTASLFMRSSRGLKGDSTIIFQGTSALISVSLTYMDPLQRR